MSEAASGISVKDATGFRKSSDKLQVPAAIIKENTLISKTPVIHIGLLWTSF